MSATQPGGGEQAWDPLQTALEDPDLVIGAQKRDIGNILKSYTGYFDLFSELIQNALDAVERRSRSDSTFRPQIWVDIDLRDQQVAVTDNGTGMSLQEFRRFLAPNISFKTGREARGSKGVGVTYLAYGFDHLNVATKPEPGDVHRGLLKDGRTWLEDTSQVHPRPTVVDPGLTPIQLDQLDRGTYVSLKLVGEHIRPKDLGHLLARTARQWGAILRMWTPLGGVYLCGAKAPDITCHIRVIDQEGNATQDTVEKPEYLYPHTVMDRTADLRDFLADQRKRAEKSQDVSRVPKRFQKLNGVWGEWDINDILSGGSPITLRNWSDEDRGALEDLGASLYVFLGFSTELWDDFNDNKLGLRKNSRILRGGLQQATRHMPQGHLVTIPLTESIGFQTITHVLVHYENAEPDLGRKGFQPEITRFGERLAVAAVSAFKRYYGRLLRKRTGAPSLVQGARLDEWIESQKQHEKENPLVISGKGLFAPREELPIRSVPLVEQDVVALFNQMLSSGLVRGLELLASSQTHQYDGLYRIHMVPPFDKYVRGEENPLGVPEDQFIGIEQALQSPVQVLEYKYSLDALIEEFGREEKRPEDIGLVVTWEVGERWAESFEILSYLDPRNIHHRQYHGITHSVSHAVSGAHAFELIALRDLVAYVVEREEEEGRQQAEYGVGTG